MGVKRSWYTHLNIIANQACVHIQRRHLRFKLYFSTINTLLMFFNDLLNIFKFDLRPKIKNTITLNVTLTLSHPQPIIFDAKKPPHTLNSHHILSKQISETHNLIASLFPAIHRNSSRISGSYRAAQYLHKRLSLHQMVFETTGIYNMYWVLSIRMAEWNVLYEMGR